MDSELLYVHSTINAGKTLNLLATAYNFEEKGIHFVCLKPSIDTRDGVGVIHSRIGIERECVSVPPTMNVYALVEEMKQNDKDLKKVMVDECQFLTEAQVDQLGRITDELDIDVMCYGLRTDFLTEAFEGSRRLFEIADTIEEVKSLCSCGRKAIINARFDSEGYLVLSGDKVMIGGENIYRPLCRRCYEKEADKTLNRNVLDLFKELGALEDEEEASEIKDKITKD